MSEFILKYYFYPKIENIFFYEHDTFKTILIRIFNIYNDKKIKTLYNKIYLNKYVYNQKNKLENKTLYHINSGGYGAIFKIDNNHCLKILLSQYKYSWSIPKEIENLLKNSNDKDYLNFITIPQLIIEDCFFYGLLQAYVIHIFILSLIDVFIFNTKKQTLFDWVTSIFDIINSPTECENLYNKILKISPIKKVYKLYTNILFQIYNNEKPISFLNKTQKFISLVNTNKIVFNKDNDKYFVKLENDIKKILNQEFNYNVDISKTNINMSNFETNKYEMIKKLKAKFKFLFGHLIIFNLGYGDIYNVYLTDKNEISLNTNTNHHLIINDDKYIVMFFLQILIIIYYLNKYYDFLHNDLKPDNILIFPSKSFNIQIENTIFNFNESFVFKLNDFDFSKLKLIKNDLIRDSIVDKANNIYSDIHYLFSTFFINKAIIKKYQYLYEELYNTFIKEHCKICKKKYNNYINKNEFEFEDHRDRSKIDLDVVKNFILTSNLFNYWKE